MENKLEGLKRETERILKIDPDNEQAHFELGRIYREQEEYALSIKEFEKILENNFSIDPFFENRLLNEVEISQRKIVLESKPQGLVVMLSNICNISCIMCEPRRRSWELPARAIKEIAEHFPCLEYIQWQGGEIFLLDYFENIFDEASRYPNLRQVINTNGLLITENWARKLVQNKVDLTFSVDGVTKDVYEYIRRGARFEDLLKGIRLINEAKEKYGKIRTAITSVIMKSNYQQLELILDFTKEYKFDGFLLARIDGNLDSQENIFHHKDLEAEDYIKKTLPKISKKAKDYGIELRNYLYPDEELGVSKDNDFGSSANIQSCDISNNSISNEGNGIICYLPWRELTIDFVGVRPDCRCPIAAGSILEKFLSDIWNNEIMQLYRKKLLTHDHVNFCRPECSLDIIPRRFLKGIAV